MPRRTTWLDNHISQGIASGGQGKVRLAGTGTAGSEVTRGQTVTRIIINPLSLFSNTVAGAWGVQAVHMGIGVSSLEAFNTSGALPDPETPGEAPASGWLWKTEFMVSQNGISMDPVQRMIVDIRSQRKMDQGVLFLVVSNVSAFGTTFTVNVHGYARTLVKLP